MLLNFKGLLARDESIENSIENIHTLGILNAFFITFLLLDIIFQFFLEAYYAVLSSVILITALSIAGYLISKKQDLKSARVVSAIAFYIIAVYHSYFMEIIISYFILLLEPILVTLLFKETISKIIALCTSSILFFVCNLFAGLHLFENALFFIGLVPSFFAVLYFYNQLNIIETQKNQLIEELEIKNDEIMLFSQMMGHDLKAPLRSINSFSQLLKRRLSDSDKTEKEYLTFIINNANNMNNLISDLLTYSKTSTDIYNFEPIDLDDLFFEQKVTFQHEIQKGNLIIESDKLGTIIGNRNALKTVFQNLISNAVKYQPFDKENHIPKISIKSQMTKDNLFLFFSDNGIGIKAKNQEKMFTPFTRFHSSIDYEGTGLGLSICKKILNKHFGDINIHTTDDTGTCFKISLSNKLDISKKLED